MNDFNPEQFEAELQTLRPAKPPERATARILKALAERATRDGSPAGSPRPRLDWAALARWLVPAAAVIVLLGGWLFGHPNAPAEPPRPRHLASSAHPLLKADKVEIDRRLVADFDAVAKLPSGEPVRFHCQQWMEKVSLRDTAKGLVIEQTAPRLEIVPVRFETE
jgi:hypothetical protein